MPRKPRGGINGRPRKRQHAIAAAEALERGEYDCIPAAHRISTAALDVIELHYPGIDRDAVRYAQSTGATQFRLLRELVRTEYRQLQRTGSLRDIYGPGSRLATTMASYLRKRDAMFLLGWRLTTALKALGLLEKKSDRSQRDQIE